MVAEGGAASESKKPKDAKEEPKEPMQPPKDEAAAGGKEVLPMARAKKPTVSEDRTGGTPPAVDKV